MITSIVPSGGQQHVEAAARTEVEHGLAGLQICQ
jgi:hypothetical protein